MNEEKMMILRMLEQGKISSAEAAKLLDALKERTSKERSSKERSSKERSNGGVDSSSFTKDLGKKVESLSRDLEPKLKKATQTILDKTAYFAEKLSKSLSESNSFSSFVGGQEKNLELLVGYRENIHFRLNGKNGMVYVKGYNGDKITANVKYAPKGENQLIELVEVGNTIYLNYDEIYFNKVAIEAFIPETLFTKLYIETSYDQICVDGLKVEDMNVYTSKGQIELKNITVGKLEAETNQGRITLDGIIGKSVAAETSNGIIEMKRCDIKEIDLVTSDSEIMLDASTKELNQSEVYEWDLETSNATIRINTPKVFGVAYDLEASTSLNGVQVNLADINYKENEKNHIRGISNNYYMAAKKINLNLETSNAPIIIN